MYKIPLLPELGITRVWEDAMLVPLFSEYIPNEWANGKGADRTFFWAILVHLEVDYVHALISDVKQQRTIRRQEQLQQVPRSIQIADEWVERLLEGQFVSSKCNNFDQLVLASRVRNASLLISRNPRPNRPRARPAPIIPRVSMREFLEEQERLRAEQNGQQQQH